MKAKITGRVLEIDIHEVLESLTLDEKRAVADSLACKDDVIKDVADQITEGWRKYGVEVGDDKTLRTTRTSVAVDRHAL